MDGRRYRGTPKKNLVGVIMEDMRECGVSTEMVMNRDLWMAIKRVACVK